MSQTSQHYTQQRRHSDRLKTAKHADVAVDQVNQTQARDRRGRKVKECASILEQC